MKILITGRKGKLYETVVRALPSSRGLRVVAVPVGATLLEKTGATSFDALIFTLSNSEEAEPLRWIFRQQNRSLPVVAVLGQPDSKLRAKLREEGVSQVVEIRGLSAARIRRRLRESLSAVREGLSRRHPAGKILEEVHLIRSSLTAILGNAELAAKKTSPSPKVQQPLQEIVRGVQEIEGILRRIERRLKAAVSAE